MTAWATRDGAGTVRVLVINRSTARSERVTVPGERARALTVTTANGLRVGAHPWPRWQDDAHIDLGRFERTVSGRDGRLGVTLPAASAVVLTLPGQRSS